ncbi:MAG: hypothetical protein IT449_07855 [Phycisphaerales bacterium]|nr:hypothetical protein [Phycisphaerales bacterium]
MARSVVLIAALMAFARYAYVRITTPASQPAGLGAGDAEDEKPQPGDCTQELDGLLSAIPPMNPSGAAAVRGRSRAFLGSAMNLQVVVRGEWSPERPEIEAAIEYLDSAAVRTFMAGLDALPPRPFLVDLLGFRGRSRINWNQLQAVFPLLAAEARYATESGDAPRAWRSIRVMFWLLDGIETGAETDAGGLGFESLSGYTDWFENQACTEAGDAARRLDLDAGLRNEMDSWLAARPRLSQLWPARMERMRREASRLVDASFTLNEVGNGWLVVSTQTPALWWTGSQGIMRMGGAPDARSRVWNVFSVVYNDRHTVTRKLDELLATLTDLHDIPHREALRRIRAVQQGRAGGFNALDGPQFGSRLSPEEFGSLLRIDYDAIKRSDTGWDGVRILLALRAYHGVRGEFPETLGELSPEWLDPVPADPYSGCEFVYRRQGEDYILYSVGSNGKDDGGQGGGQWYWGIPSDEKGDVLLTNLRQ